MGGGAAGGRAATGAGRYQLAVAHAHVQSAEAAVGCLLTLSPWCAWTPAWSDFTVVTGVARLE